MAKQDNLMDDAWRHLIDPREIHWRPWLLLSAALLVIGGIAFCLGLSGAMAQRAWQAYLVNLVFWFGLSAGAVLLVAVMNVTHARWGRPLKRLAEALGTFLPISFLLLWGLYFGREEIFPWIREPVHGKEAWLNVPFLFGRDGFAMLLLAGSAVALIYCSVKEDLEALRQPADAGGADFLSPPGAPAREGKTVSRGRLQILLSPAFAILYGLVLSLIGFDLVMSLDPHWYSTLFGGYYFVGSFYTALAAMAVMAGLGREVLGLREVLQPRHFHDLGKLLLGFCLMTGYLFYSQFLVIWYGNLPEETVYVLARVREAPWSSLAWAVLGACFAFPFAGLLFRKLKRGWKPMMGMGLIILFGMWLERFLLVAPSLSKGKELSFGWMEISVSAGFLGAAGLTVLFFLRSFPLLPAGDPLFREEALRILEETRGNRPEGRETEKGFMGS